MKKQLLVEEINYELSQIDLIVDELISLYSKIGDNEPGSVEKTAAAAFISQFYNGIENILKRINNFYDLELPRDMSWHLELFKRFQTSSDSALPKLFSEELSNKISPYRKFRHVFFHGYSFNLEWNRMKEGIINIQSTYSEFKISINQFLNSL